jgi:hypothetical protein
MPPAGFEPAIPARERPQTHAWDGAATGIGITLKMNTKSMSWFSSRAANNPVLSFLWPNYEYYCLVRCDAVECGSNILTLRKNLLLKSSNLKIVAAGSFESPVTYYRTARRHIPEDGIQADSRLTCHEIPSRLWNLPVHNRVHISPS